ncbi:MAG: hypothetical protein JST55_00350 [Bacteroidetes bacterium]|nr:hypothetical protein [Bacteroidota bacterium]
MFNKKIFAMILSAALLSGAISVGAYKIFTKNTPSTVTTDPNVNFQSIVDSIDYTENLLDSNQVYKQKFENDLTSQGKWIPVKQKDFIRELTNPTQTQNDAPDIQNVSNQDNEPVAENNNTVLANNKAPANDDDTFIEEVPTTNITSSNIEPVRTVTETKTIEKIIYIWQPNECSDRNWNPYTNGHWEFTCAGWVWASDYRWGNHCYNYGRWMWTSFAGWVWMPGGRWAPNWVTWRYCGNYYGGSYCSWYPTCPVVYWQNPHHLIVCNSHFTSNPIHWTVVNTNDITKHIPIKPKVDTERNIEIINNSEKIKNVQTLVTNNQKIKYNGPNVNEISKVTNTQITPKVINIPTKSEGTIAGVNNTNPTKNPNGPKTPVKVTPVKQQNEINPVKLIDDITKQNVSNPGNGNITKDPQIKQPPVKNTTTTNTTTTIKTAGPSVNNPTKEGVKTEPPAKNLPPVKNTTTTKTETPKQEGPKNNPPVKNDPPKYNPPPVKNDPPKYDPPKYDPPKYDPPPVKNDPPPVKNDPPPVKQDPPKQDPPKQDPPKQDPPQKKDDKKGD